MRSNLFKFSWFANNILPEFQRVGWQLFGVGLPYFLFAPHFYSGLFCLSSYENVQFINGLHAALNEVERFFFCPVQGGGFLG